MFKGVETTLRPRSVAIVGASDQNPWARSIYGNLVDYGFPGEVWLVNPKYPSVWGRDCFESIGKIGTPVDHAVIVVGSDTVYDILSDGVKAGLKSALVFAANLGEGGSRGRGASLARLCDETGLVICGPNCLGTLSYRERLFLFPSRPLADVPAGSVGMISQSGGTVQAFVKAAGDRGVKFSYAVSSGNELNLDLADYLNFMVDDPETRVIVLFLEAIRRPQAFMIAAERALRAGKPIIAFKVGRSETARTAALSHTGAIAGDYAAYEAVCERYGIVNCASLEAVLETTLAFQAGRLPRGPRMAFVTTSGAMVDMLHDDIDALGVTVAKLAPATKAKLKGMVQQGIKPKNPLDAGSPKGLPSAAQMCEAILADPNVDMAAWAVWLGRSAGFGDLTPMRRVVDATDKPMLGFGRMHAQMNSDALDVQDGIGFPFLQGVPDTLQAMQALAFYAARKGRAIPALPKPKGRPEALVEPALQAELAAHGIHGPRQHVAASLTEALQAAGDIGFPVALKIIAEAASHKTEVGGVLLGLVSAAEVEEGWNHLHGLVDPSTGQSIVPSGILVQEMVQGVEAIVGVRTDPLYGPLIVVGSGGVLVELVGDVATRLLPIGRGDARAMIAELKLSRLLGPFRGRGAADLEALVSLVVGLGRFFAAHRGHLAEMEINPVIVRAKGQGAAAVDVRLVRRPGH
jgi:acyl-CoA synthetase (NDP forming)